MPQRVPLAGAVAAAAVLSVASVAAAAPRHDVCADLGASFGWGVSSYSQAGDWPTTVHDTDGVDWRFLYVYVLPTSDPPAAVRDFWTTKDGIARTIGAIPVFTFYELLTTGYDGGVTGTSEADVVRQVLASPALMAQYFDAFVFLLQTLATFPPPVYVQVEPDSWGFMMWSMGVDGNTDPTTIPVRVAASGRSELAGFADDAGGLAHALLALRDTYAPEVRMGWHASNFRVGARPEVVTAFYAGLGDWDVVFTEHPHNELDDAMWWLPWDDTRLATNLAWLSTVSSSAHLPILIWQAPIGTTDWHMLGNGSDLSVLTLYANAGVAGTMFELEDSGTDVDAFRASGMFGALSTVPPPSSGADGTAGALRTRLAAYAHAPLAWPPGSICARTVALDGGVDAGAGDAAVSLHDASTALDASSDAARPTATTGCGCSATPMRAPLPAVSVLSLCALVWRRRRGRRGLHRGAPIGACP